MFTNFNDNLGYGPKIKCEVTNCKHHGDQGYCTADVIKVGPGFASCTAETACATFELKK